MRVAMLLTTFAAAVAKAPNANTSYDAGGGTSPLSNHPENNVLLAGLVRDANGMSPNVFDFIVEMTCEHFVPVQILAAGDFDMFQAEYDSVRRNGYEQNKYRNSGIECASMDILYSPHIDDSNQSIGSIEELREYQKNVIRDELEGERWNTDLDHSIVVLADLDLRELPSTKTVINHAKDMGSGILEVDVLCSNSALVFGDDANNYYDIYSTVLLPDTFVCPIQWRKIAKVGPNEDPEFVLSDASAVDNSNEKRSFTNADLFRWFEREGKGEHSTREAMNPVPVHSCFGGLAVYKARKFIDTRCSYYHGSGDTSNDRYKSRNDKVSEHLIWNKCMNSADPEFMIAIQPDMVTKYGNIMDGGVQAQDAFAWKKRSLEVQTPTSLPTNSPTSPPSNSPTRPPSMMPSTQPSISPSERPSHPTAPPTKSPVGSTPAPTPFLIPCNNRQLMMSSSSSALEFNNTTFIKRRVNDLSDEFTMETVREDQTSNPWCLDVYECCATCDCVGDSVGLRPCEPGKFSQIFRQDNLLKVYLAIRLNLCIAVDDNFGVFVQNCASRYSCNPSGIDRWNITGGQFVALGDNGERFPAALNPFDEAGALIVVPDGEPIALPFTKVAFTGLSPCISSAPNSNRQLMLPPPTDTATDEETFVFNNATFIKRRVDSHNPHFTMETIRKDKTSNPWCLDVFSCCETCGCVGNAVGLRLCDSSQPSQIFQQNALRQVYLAMRLNLCLSVGLEDDDGNVRGIYLQQCSSRYSCNPDGIRRWDTDNGQLVALGDNGERFPAAINPLDEDGALIIVPEDDPNPLAFNKTIVEYEGFYIKTNFQFDNSVRTWCLQAINKRKNANLNVRPCEERTKQKWRFDKEGKLRLSSRPQFCIINVRGKILKLGFCDDRNIAKFSFDEDKGGILALKRATEKFYIGFNTVKKFDRLRLYSDASTNVSPSSWRLVGFRASETYD